MSAIVVRELTKKFRRQLVFNDFNLEVFDGEIFSVMGLEGSGKTTLARILFNFYKPNKGSVTIFDMDAQKESKSVKEFTSYIPADVWVYDNLKPTALFKQTLAFHGLKNTDDIQSLMDYFELDDKHKLLDLTDSERKRVAIVNALITKPKLLVIDDPTKSLGRGMVEKLFTHLQRLKRSEGLSVLLLTDDLSIGQRFADRGAYLSGGRLVGIEYLKEKKNNDKLLRIFDELVAVDAFESIGADLLKDESGDVQFFFDGYLPTLTTVLHQQKIKNYTLEDAQLENKVDAFKQGKTPQTVVVERAEEDVNLDVPREDTITEDTILAYDVDRLDSFEVGGSDGALKDPFDKANESEDETIVLNAETFENAGPQEDEDIVETEATSQFVVHKAKSDVSDDSDELKETSVDEKPIEAADADVDFMQNATSDPYRSEGLIHDTRKMKPVQPVDDYGIQEEKYDFSPGKGEN